MKKAFTLLELIFVIVIIGLLSIAGTDIFLRIYDSYFQSRTYNEMQAKTQLALDQIANRLTYRIKSSVIISWGSANDYTSIESANETTVPAGEPYRLEWIAYDNDSFRGMAATNTDTYIKPGWSAFIDLDASDGNSLHTPGGNSTLAESIMNALSYGDINLSVPTTNTNAAVVIFPDAAGSVNQYGWFQDPDTRLTHPVSRSNDVTLNPTVLNGFTGIANEVYENYQLAFSAYALEYNTTAKTLTLHYNYQPWNGERYLDGNNTLFLGDVSNFIFTQVGTILKIQLCVDNNSSDSYALCKERAIF